MPESRFTLPPQYDPHAVERPLYRRWLERGVFTARADSPKSPYVIVIPPPNVTAVLHMGQGLNNVTQDVLIRFERMRGREAVGRLWEQGLMYRGHRVIHWCPRCLTDLSDEEAECRDVESKLYYIRYPVEGGPAPYVTVATTRPETLLGDTAVAVNPPDKRHRAFVGKVARLPIIDLPVPIIADDAVEPGFGTGFVKVTPAHDATDFEI